MEHLDDSEFADAAILMAYNVTQQLHVTPRYNMRFSDAFRTSIIDGFPLNAFAVRSEDTRLPHQHEKVMSYCLKEYCESEAERGPTVQNVRSRVPLIHGSGIAQAGFIS